MAYFGPWESAFTNAEKYLAGGKDKNDRPIQNNTRLRRIDADTIAVVLHHTAVVTYHRDGTFTIYGGGWDSVTTKARISEHSPSRPHSSGSSGTWVVGTTGELTPARVTKCRTCHGRGRWMEDDVCHPSWAWNAYCSGGTTAYTVPFEILNIVTRENNFEEHYASRHVVPCEHGQTERHLAVPCRHAEMDTHVTGQSEHVCYRCKGEGRVDYGSLPIPITVSAGTPFKVDADGTFLHTVDTTPSTYKMWTPTTASKPKPHKSIGSETATRLAKVLPGMNATVTNPATNGRMSVREAIVSLNDGQGWTRERIADWLDTLDVDLSFSA